MSNEIRISKRANTVKTSDCSSLSWEGVLFLPGKAEGETSANEFLRLAIETGLESSVCRLKGLFFAVYQNPQGERFAFVDNCGYFFAYRSQSLISTDFFDFLGSSCQLDLVGMTDLLREGGLFFDRTPIAGVSRIEADSIIAAKPGASGFSTLSKGLAEVFKFESGLRPPEEIIAESLESFRGRKIALDLTGGLDTRLGLAFCLSAKIPFTAFSHGIPGHPDIEIPKRLAELGGFEYRPLFIDPKSLPNDLPDMLASMDYLHNTACFHANYKMNQALLENGFDLRVQSGEAVLLRDFWMFSDWPFFRKQKPNLARVYSMRMRTKPHPQMFAGTLVEKLDRSYDTDMVNSLENLYWRSPARLANEAVAFQFRYRAGSGRVLTSANRQMPTLPLFCDYELMHSSANMPLSHKRMHRFFRDQVSSASPALARVKTDRGQSFRNSNSAILADNIVLFFDLIGRMARKIRYRLVEKPMKRSLEPSETAKLIRALPQFPPALNTLQEAGLINSNLSANKIPTGKIGNIIAAAEIIRRIS